MSPAQILERVYAALKHHLLLGRYPMGQRLEAARLANDLHVSITPVRDVLNRLAGEQLVRAIPGDGFYVPTLDERALRDLFDWTMHLLVHALRAATPSLAGPIESEVDIGHATRTARLFQYLVDSLNSIEFSSAMASVNDRLHPMRAREPRFLSDVQEEIAGLERALAADNFKLLVQDIRIYHRRRRAAVSDYIRARASDS